MKPDGALHGAWRVVLEPEREREEEEHLRVGRALDRRIQLGIDRQHELALHPREVADEAVVHPEPAAVAERMAVRLLHGRSGGRSDVREDEPRPDVRGEVSQVSIAPGRLDAVERPRRLAVAVPADAEAVAVRRLRTHRRVQALVDERVLRLVEQVLEKHGRPRIRKPAAHYFAPDQDPRARILVARRSLKVSASRPLGGCLIIRISARRRSRSPRRARGRAASRAAGAGVRCRRRACPPGRA